MTSIDPSARGTGMARHAGFTLIELMVTVVVLGVLASIAVPVYTQYIQSARRADARLALLQASNQLEKFYSNNLVYTENLAELGLVSTSPDAYYRMRIVSVDVDHYRVVAEAAADASQFADTSCRSLSLDAAGVEQAEDASGKDSTDDCW